MEFSFESVALLVQLDQTIMAKIDQREFSFRQFISVFFRPLNKKYRFWTLSASLIIGSAFYAGVDIGLAEVVRQNSYPIYALSAELLRELGPEYVKASEDHAEIIDKYTEHVEQRYEQRYLATILRILYPKYSPKKVLASVLSDFEKVEKADKDKREELAKKLIRQAGEQIRQFSIDTRRYPRSPIQWFESEVVSDELLSDLNDAFDRFHKRVDKLENARTLEAARDEYRNACIDSRRALLLLSLTRLGYDNREKKIERFLGDLKQARKLSVDFAEKYTSEQKLFEDRADNMGLRAEVVEAMLDNDMDSVTKRLSEEIERAIADRQASES